MVGLVDSSECILYLCARFETDDQLVFEFRDSRGMKNLKDLSPVLIMNSPLRGVHQIYVCTYLN